MKKRIKLSINGKTYTYLKEGKVYHRWGKKEYMAYTDPLKVKANVTLTKPIGLIPKN